MRPVGERSRKWAVAELAPVLTEAQLPAGVAVRGLRHRLGDLLPMSVRRRARVLAGGGRTPPRGLGAVLTLLLFAAGWGYGVVLDGDARAVGGEFGALVEAATAAAGFGIRSIRISGQQQTDEGTILTALGVHKGSSMLFFNAEAARRRVEAGPWVERAAVRKLFPDTLEVVVHERRAFARWQHDLAVSVIDRSGKVLSRQVPETLSGLPLVAGAGAAERAAALFEIIDRHPFLSARLNAASLIAERRWMLLFDNGVRVQLPEKGVAAAVAELAALERDRNILDLDIVGIDLRFSDRIFIRVRPELAAARRAALKKRAKEARRNAELRI